ncbi:MAG: DUF1836 domain-containing protein [Clostridia bacterium]
MGKTDKYKNIKDKKITNFHIPRWAELPDIDVYLDQLVTYIEKYLNPYIGSEDTPVITKTMINNYVKQQIIPAPNKKKYRKDHIAHIFVICILKQVYSINNISNLIELASNTTKLILAYDQFCSELENAVTTVFNGEEYEIADNISIEHKLLKSVVLSFAHKLYVEKVFLAENNTNK